MSLSLPFLVPHFSFPRIVHISLQLTISHFIFLNQKFASQTLKLLFVNQRYNSKISRLNNLCTQYNGPLAPVQDCQWTSQL